MTLADAASEETLAPITAGGTIVLSCCSVPTYGTQTVDTVVCGIHTCCLWDRTINLQVQASHSTSLKCSFLICAERLPELPRRRSRKSAAACPDDRSPPTRPGCGGPGPHFSQPGKEVCERRGGRWGWGGVIGETRRKDVVLLLFCLFVCFSGSLAETLDHMLGGY